jgi:4-amino-4-deoxy-L-arabinose transferase-like glycosyltransferase
MAIETPVAPATVPLSAPSAPQPPRLLLPMALILLATIAWALTLNNGIFIDESLYIRTGRAYIDHWVYGTPLPSWIGQGFSGLPVLYPVLAGALDYVGGLVAVRLFSLVCIIATMLLLRSIAAQLFTRRTGLVTAAIFGLTGPVLYVGHLGTFDALVILMLVTAWWLGMRKGWWVVLVLGPLLALAVATKYTAYVFVPSVLVLSTFKPYSMVHSTSLRTWLHPHLPWKRIARAVVAGLIAVGLVALGYLFTDATTRESLAFTTTGRNALSPTPRGDLVSTVPNFVWPTFFAALLGLVWLLRARRWTAVLWGLLLIGTALLLPVAQIKLGEGVSFQKHLAYSAAFLAPLAGWGFARPWRLAIWTPVLVWWLILMAVWGGFRSNDLIQYPDVRPVAEAVHFKSGTYLSSSADSMSYYTRRDPDIKWETTFGLYVQGPKEIRRAIRQDHYDQVIIHAGPTGSSTQDEGQRVLIKALENNFYTVKEVGEDKEWLIYTPLTTPLDD